MGTIFIFRGALIGVDAAELRGTSPTSVESVALMAPRFDAIVSSRHNWTFFANETGLRWYTAFRSLIASCRLHGLNAETYLEEVLRLAPHWPAHRVLELAPKYWTATREGLDDKQRAILARPWEALVEQAPSDASPLPLAS